LLAKWGHGGSVQISRGHGRKGCWRVFQTDYAGQIPVISTLSPAPGNLSRVTEPDVPLPRTRHPLLRLLHLLWAVPLAALVSIPLLLIAKLDQCGISGCSGGGFGVDTSGRADISVLTFGVGFVFFLAIGLAPCLKPWWLRLAIGLVVGIAIGLIMTLGFTSNLSGS
jgi:hypothetical protein